MRSSGFPKTRRDRNLEPEVPGGFFGYASGGQFIRPTCTSVLFLGGIRLRGLQKAHSSILNRGRDVNQQAPRRCHTLTGCWH